MKEFYILHSADFPKKKKLKIQRKSLIFNVFLFILANNVENKIRNYFFNKSFFFNLHLKVRIGIE